MLFRSPGADPARQVNKALTKIMRIDIDDPFLTTGGRSYWSDGDWNAYFGQYPFFPYRRGMSASTYSQVQWTYPTNRTYQPDLAHGGGSDATIVGNYQIRPVAEDHAFVSRKLDDVAGLAVASDAIWGFYARHRGGSGWRGTYLEIGRAHV